MQEGGAFMNEGLLATLNANIEAMQKEKADALALVESLTAEKNDLTAKVEELTAQAEIKEAEHTKAIDDLNAAHATALEEKDNQISALEQEKADIQGEVNAKAENIEAMQTELNGAKESLTTAQNTIAERDQQISDLNAQIEELENEPGEGAQAGASPASNGTGAEVAGVAISTQYVMDPSLSYDENMKAKKEWEAAHK
jgi:chromosome segregation ATPase